jgi:hypothetical protein
MPIVKLLKFKNKFTLEELVMSKTKTPRMSVKCAHEDCGYRWVPDPRKWTNHLNEGRVLTCPRCRKPKKITPALEKRILKRNSFKIKP